MSCVAIITQIVTFLLIFCYIVVCFVYDFGDFWTYFKQAKLVSELFIVSQELVLTVSLSFVYCLL